MVQLILNACIGRVVSDDIIASMIKGNWKNLMTKKYWWKRKDF